MVGSSTYLCFSFEWIDNVTSYLESLMNQVCWGVPKAKKLPQGSISARRRPGIAIGRGTNVSVQPFADAQTMVESDLADVYVGQWTLGFRNPGQEISGTKPLKPYRPYFP